MGCYKFFSYLFIPLQHQNNRSCYGDQKVSKIKNMSIYLVLDFESTCWENDKTIPPEVIEFPVVLLDLKSGKILEEFQQFVFPTEHATLSDFCTKFTGITQGQIEENGVPLSTAIGLFIKWLSNLSLKYGFSVVPSKSREKLATFTTWSDWDLGRCLKFECNRKSISKPSYFNHWIDLRALYKV
ncbi:ERI1 exoribonuclease 2 [Armadillidium nasatum]|uniref:ERI1 exoribonuclease 2 n=1 Tax=Armadillidium nasatum TaxID=96803 RepID=A0A5N5TCE8_9CRUS|nr:ERI1 exoribonuclease 2 [Armadillidium nasatum]